MSHYPIASYLRRKDNTTLTVANVEASKTGYYVCYDGQNVFDTGKVAVYGEHYLEVANNILVVVCWHK